MLKVIASEENKDHSQQPSSNFEGKGKKQTAHSAGEFREDDA